MCKCLLECGEVPAASQVTAERRGCRREGSIFRVGPNLTLPVSTWCHQWAPYTILLLTCQQENSTLVSNRHSQTLMEADDFEMGWLLCGLFGDSQN